MLIAERHHRIIQLLQANGKVEYSTLSEELDVSVDTIRRDLNILSEAGKLLIVRGGAIPTPGTISPLSYQQRMGADAAEKQLLCKAAAREIKSGESLFICNSTTTLALSRFIAHKGPLSIVANGLNIAQGLQACENVTTHLTGGEMRRESGSMVGPAAETTLSWYSFDKVFLTAGGIHPSRGIATNTLEMASLLRTAARQAREVWYLMPASKIGRLFFALVSEASAMDILVTTSAADGTYLEQLRELGIRVILADKTEGAKQ